MSTKREIGPGEAATISVEMNASQQGDQSSTITVYTNAKGAPKLVVAVTWTGVAPLQINLPAENLGSLRVGQIVSKTIEIQPPPSGVVIESVWPESDLLQIGEIDKTSSPWRLPVQISAGTTHGEVSASVLFGISGAWPPEMTKQYLWNAVPIVSATPSRISMGVGHVGQTSKATILLRNHLEEPLVVEAVEFANAMDGVSHTVSDVASRLLTLNLEWRPLTTGVHVGRLKVRFKSPAGTSIELPISGICESKE